MHKVLSLIKKLLSFRHETSTELPSTTATTASHNEIAVKSKYSRLNPIFKTAKTNKMKLNLISSMSFRCCCCCYSSNSFFSNSFTKCAKCLNVLVENEIKKPKKSCSIFNFKLKDQHIANFCLMFFFSTIFYLYFYQSVEY